MPHPLIPTVTGVEKTNRSFYTFGNAPYGVGLIGNEIIIIIFNRVDTASRSTFAVQREQTLLVCPGKGQQTLCDAVSTVRGKRDRVSTIE